LSGKNWEQRNSLIPVIEIAEKVVLNNEVKDYTRNSPFRKREIQRDLS
jgi:hypothetical protein